MLISPHPDTALRVEIETLERELAAKPQRSEAPAPASHYPKAARGHERVYRIWRAMHVRCRNPKASNYRNYGARGISVCEEWREFGPFLVWALANGYDHHLTIERQNSDLGYGPANCSWATKAQQAINRRNVPVSPDGTPWSAIAVQNGLRKATYSNRIYLGWDPEVAATTPTSGRYVRTKRPSGARSDAARPVRGVPRLAHFIALERQEDDNRVAASRREMARSSGVHFGGMGAEPWPRRSDAQLRADAEARRQRLIEWRAGAGPSMFGRF